MISQSTYSNESEARNQRILVLETSVHNLTMEKDTIFDQLQMRQAELESSQAHMESLQSQTTEYQYQIRELQDRTALLTEELAEAQVEHKSSDSTPAISAEDVTRLLSNAEAKYEARLADLRKQLDAVERERNEADAEWSSKFSTKAREVEELKRTINSNIRNNTDSEQAVGQLRNEVERLKEDIRTYQKRSVDLQRQAEKVQEVEVCMFYIISVFVFDHVSPGHYETAAGGHCC
jgi:chromosome segregation ATPase